MPPAQLNVGPELDIQLDNIGRPYQAGDVITGRVVRQAHAVSPRATVTIELLGRAKSKIVVTSSSQSLYSTSLVRKKSEPVCKMGLTASRHSTCIPTFYLAASMLILAFAQMADQDAGQMATPAAIATTAAVLTSSMLLRRGDNCMTGQSTYRPVEVRKHGSSPSTYL